MIKSLTERLDLMSKDIIEAETYLADNNFYFDFLFEVDANLHIKWDAKEKRLWILKSPNPCRFCECPVDTRTICYNQLPEMFEAIHLKALHLLEECKIEHTHERMKFKFKELRGIK